MSALRHLCSKHQLPGQRDDRWRSSNHKASKKGARKLVSQDPDEGEGVQSCDQFYGFVAGSAVSAVNGNARFLT